MAAATMNHEEARRVVPHERAQHMNMTRVALATYAALPALHPDDQLLLASLRTMGIASEAAVWASAHASRHG